MTAQDELLKQFAALEVPQREELILLLSERFQVVPPRWNHHFFRQDYPSIVKTPNVCGGAARLIRTRVPVWSLERMRQLGFSEVEILQSYPSLQATDLVQAWSYVDQHREEIHDAIRQNEEA